MGNYEMKDGVYESILVNGNEILLADKYLMDLANGLRGIYNDVCMSRDESGIDDETSCEIRVSGEMIGGVFSPSQMTMEYSSVDEMNHVVCQTLYADFLTGQITVMDEDEGCICKAVDEDYILYG